MPDLTCPCCGYMSGLTDQYDICGYCGWMHDPNIEFPDVPEDAANWTLRKAQRFYMAHGVSDPGVPAMREPQDETLKDPEWMPLDAYRSDDLKLLLAAQRGETDEVGALLGSGAAVEVSFRHGIHHSWTSLIWAAHGYGRTVQVLLGYGANPNARGKHSASPLVAAARTCSVEIVKALMRAGADPKLPDNSGISAAQQLDSPSLVQWLLVREPGSDPTERIERMRRALSETD